MGLTALFDTIHESYCTILANFYLWLHLVQCKSNSKCKMNTRENIFKKGKYFQVFGCISKNALENIFSVWLCS